MSSSERSAKTAFISYSSADAAAAVAIVHELRAQGLNVWYSPDHIPGGAYYAADIERALRGTDALLLLASGRSVGDTRRGLTGSKQVAREIELAIQLDLKIIPLLLDSVLPERAQADGFGYHLSTCQHIDIREAVRAGAYPPCCKEIRAAIDGMPADRGERGRAQIEQVEQLLMKGQWERAQQALLVPVARGKDLDRAKLLRIVAQLQGAAPLARLMASQVEAHLEALKALCATEEASAALYLMGVLARYYFQPNGLFDPNGGTRELTARARTAGKLSARTLNVVRPALPDGHAFELEWKRTT